MFKFIHAADIHLDSPLRGLSRYESAPAESIRNACRRAFENLVDLAIEERAAFVLLAGDLYDGDWKDYSTGIFLSRQLGRLGRHHIPVFAVAGNHDAANRMTRALDVPANLTMFSSRRVETIRLEEPAAVIHGRSFGSRHVDENLAAEFGPGEPGLFNIGLLHTSLDGREGHAVYAPCTADDLRSKNYQYWALGHVHQAEIVSEHPWIVFPGCIQGRHIREAGVKGCMLVTVDDGMVREVELVPLDVLRWARCRIDLAGAAEREEVLERTRRAIEEERNAADSRPLAMRIRFEGASAVSKDLAAHPERLEQQIKALGAEMAGEALWIERIENATLGRQDLDSALAGDTAFSGLLREILATSNRVEEIDGLREVVTGLRQKIPAEAFHSDTGLDLDAPQTVERLIEEARQMLIGRLLTEGGPE